MKRWVVVPSCFVALAMGFGGSHTASGPEPAPEGVWAEAAERGEQAHEAFARSHRLLHAWYAQRGKDNYLLPRNLRTRTWEVKDSAADLWPFLVITAYLTDPEALESLARQTLRDEIRLTTRLGWLSDDYDIDDHRFVRPEVEIDRLIFGASEYLKDGLLPIIELMGRTAWLDRARTLIEEIFRHAPVETAYGRIPSDDAEINGEMLQSLSRLYTATGDRRFKEWAERIGDAYFFDVLPKNNDLPAHRWDFAAGKPLRDVLSLRDHGNEIVFGLSELLILEHVHDPPKARRYLPAMRRMVDRLLAVAVNEDGLWYQRIEPTTGKVLDEATPDTWGYALNGVYVLYLVTGETRYREAVERALRGINQEKYLHWEESAGPADAYADAIEGCLYLVNRIPEPEALAWLEKVVPVFLALQRPDGIIEGWHGDGNYARTALMYALMKTAGARVQPWRPGLRLGAVPQGETLHLVLVSDAPWEGTLYLDAPRHRLHLGLSINYPRLNEFPEWYTVEPVRLYRVAVEGKELSPLLGDDLVRGLPLKLNQGPLRIEIRPEAGPPYGR